MGTSLGDCFLKTLLDISNQTLNVFLKHFEIILVLNVMGISVPILDPGYLEDV
jgi:hypothetical protein